MSGALVIRSEAAWGLLYEPVTGNLRRSAASPPRSGVGVHSTLSESSWHPQGGHDHNCMLVTSGGSDHALQIEVQALLAEPLSVSERAYGRPFRLLGRS